MREKRELMNAWLTLVAYQQVKGQHLIVEICSEDKMGHGEGQGEGQGAGQGGAGDWHHGLFGCLTNPMNCKF